MNKESTKNRSVLYLARKYLAGRSRRGISPSHYLSLGGISLGVLALLCVSSVMNGFRSDIQSRIVGTYADLRISSKEGEGVADYESLAQGLELQGMKVSPVIRNELLLKNGEAMIPTLSFGIDLKSQQQVSKTLLKPEKQHGEVIQGIITGTADPQAFEQGGIILGSGLAAALGVYLGDELQVLSPVFNVPSAFGMLPRVRYLKVQALFAAGMPEYDQNFSYIPLQEAAFFSGYADKVDYLEIKTPSLSRSKHYQKALQSRLPNYYVEDWGSFDSSLYAAIRFEKFIMFIIMMFMFIIASFNLTGNLLKTISQKKRELGLLKALGMEDKDLQRVFLWQSLLLCTLGVVLGLGLGTLLLIIQQRFGVIRLDMGDGSSMVLPVTFLVTDYILICGVSYLLTALSVLVPLRRIKAIDAVQLIRRTV